MPIRFLILLFIFSSCKHYEGAKKDTAFMPLNNAYSSLVRLSYTDMLGIQLKDIILKDSINSIELYYPTIINCIDPFFVSPGDKIFVCLDSIGNVTFKVNGKKKKNQELTTLKEVNNLFYPPIDISQIDKEITDSNFSKKADEYAAALFINNNEKIKIFDSISAQRKLSKHYIQSIHIYLQIAVRRSLLKFYSENSKNLKKTIYSQLKDSLNHIKSVNPFKYGLGDYVIEVANKILPYRIFEKHNENRLSIMFNAITANFKNTPCDFLLTKLLYEAYRNRITPSDELIKKYYRVCKSREYKSILTSLIKAVNEKERLLHIKGTNALYKPNEKEPTSLEEVLSNYKNKAILLDFWATWCVPCLKQIPFLDSLKRKYNSDELEIISLSLDKDTNRWINFLITHGVNDNQYIFSNPEQSEFLKKHEMDKIPRYILIAPGGNIINDNTPFPDSPELEKILSELLHKR